MTNFDNLCEEIKKHLDCNRQNWLFGAGISIASNVPPIYPLTARIKVTLESKDYFKQKELYEALIGNLPEGSHVEHHLSHLGDLIALSDRSKNKTAMIEGNAYKKEQFQELYGAIIAEIGYTIRYGYSKSGEEEKIGTVINPIIEIDHHLEFVKVLYKNKANLLNRTAINIFTLNYDTLLEDALAIEKYTVIDGFSGGAIGFWNPTDEFHESKVKSCKIYKLHGSVDWYRNSDTSIVRNRYGTKYLSDLSNILIYPQATKYVETQKDPFAYLFSSFRNALNHSHDNTLVTCGYSFGDDHVNSEIEFALSSTENKTVLIAFTKERGTENIVVHPILNKWLSNPFFNNRVFVATEKGVYNGGLTLVNPSGDDQLNWWTFAGLTKFLNTGDLK